MSLDPTTEGFFPLSEKVPNIMKEELFPGEKSSLTSLTSYQLTKHRLGYLHW